MNKIYKNVWCEKTGTYVAASETAKGRRAGGTSAVVGALTAVVLLGGGSFASPDVYAAAFVVCGNASTAALIPTGPTTSYNMGCTTGSDVLFMGGYSGGPGINSGASTSTTWITVNNATTPSSSVTGSIPGQSIELYAPGSIILNGSNVNVSSNKIINLANGTVAAGSGDAVNGGQLFTLSTSTSTGLSSATSSISSLSTSTSTGLSSANSSITSLSTSASTGLSSATSSISSLSTSTSTGISSLSTGLSSANSTVSSLSTSTSTGLSSATSSISSLSTSTSTGLSSANSSISSLSTSTSTGLSSANSSITSLSTSTSTGLSSANSSITS
ncbi:ESPR domain-containing protein, partial [Burkholderia cepacia]|uniref:ESPR domain-containing protein n=1 Tax=Burkholderia cepacia TaxID=292 RepID=UPI0018C50055